MLAVILTGIAAAADNGRVPDPAPYDKVVPDLRQGGATPAIPWSVVPTLSITNDYRFRGVSMTAGKPAVQGSLEIAQEHGLYAGVWASSIRSRSDTGAEADLYAGYRPKTRGLDLDLGLVSYTYFHSGQQDVTELYASAAKTLKQQIAKIGVYYAPDQRGLGSSSGFYVYGEYVSSHLRVASLRTHVGYEQGGATPNGSSKVDWLIGADVPFGRFIGTLGATGSRYHHRVQSDHAGPTVLVAISIGV